MHLLLRGVTLAGATLAAMTLLLMAASACSTGRPAGDDLGFWTALAFHAEWAEAYASVTDMAAAADLVVVGTIDQVTAGREWGDPREAQNRVASLLFTVGVDEVLHGAMPDPTVDAVAWEYTHPAYNLSQIQGRLTDDGLVEDRTGTVQPFPTRRVLLFLRLRDDLGSELTVAPEAVIVAGVPYRLVSVGGLVAETDTKAALPLMGMDADSPPGRLLAEQVADRTFDEVVDLARGE